MRKCIRPCAAVLLCECTWVSVILWMCPECMLATVLPCSSSLGLQDPHVSRGTPPSLKSWTPGDRVSRGFNGDGDMAWKVIVDLKLETGFDIPWWITTTKWEREGEYRRNYLPIIPLGADSEAAGESRVGGVSGVRFSILLHLHSFLIRSEIPEEFLHLTSMFFCSTAPLN